MLKLYNLPTKLTFLEVQRCSEILSSRSDNMEHSAVAHLRLEQPFSIVSGTLSRTFSAEALAQTDFRSSSRSSDSFCFQYEWIRARNKADDWLVDWLIDSKLPFRYPFAHWQIPNFCQSYISPTFISKVKHFSRFCHISIDLKRKKHKRHIRHNNSMRMYNKSYQSIKKVRSPNLRKIINDLDP